MRTDTRRPLGERVLNPTGGDGGSTHVAAVRADKTGRIWLEVRWEQALRWGNVKFEVLFGMHVECGVAAGHTGLEFQREAQAGDVNWESDA